MGASIAAGPHSTSIPSLFRPPALRLAAWPTISGRHAALPSPARLWSGPIRSMPFGARSPWAAADPCFRTGSRRYLPILFPTRQMRAPACHRALVPPDVLANRPGDTFRALPSISGIAPRQACAMPGRIPARGGMECCRSLFAFASRRMETEVLAALWPVEEVPLAPRLPITKAAVLRIRRSARRHLPVGYAANFPCSYRYALYP